MRVLNILGVGFFLFVGWAEAKGLQVQRKEDELLLPPYVHRNEGGKINVHSEKLTDLQKKREVKAGEWLEFGDFFALPEQNSIQIFMNEGMQWVAGGGFSGGIEGGKWDTSKPAFTIQVQHGWIRVWSKSIPFSGVLEIKTPHGQWTISQGVFWLFVGKNKTEIYLESGELVGKPMSCLAGQYCQGLKVSNQWSASSIDQQIDALYPGLVKLAHQANQDWQDEKLSKKYSELRAKGWFKTDRHYPSPSPEK